MRRFLAFVICISGFTIAVSWTRADEPAVPATDNGPTSPAAAVPSPSARPEIVRTEPGEYRRQAEEQSRESEDRQPDSTSDQLQRHLDHLYEQASHLNEHFVGPALEHARSVVEARIAQIEQIQQREATVPDDVEAIEIADLEQNLAELLAHAERLESTAGEHLEAARRAIEQRVDEVERALAERRERRDAPADRARPEPRDQPARPEGDQAGCELQEKLRHLHGALDHLRAAGFEDLARETERRMQELAAAHQAARRHAAEAREQHGEAADLQPIRGAIRDLSNEVGELRRELRRLHREVDQLRQQHHESDDAPSDRDAET
ncbi:MAG: hypothetical protein JNG89_02330 [Planctomycetaceae bacterium]|nr:hypothetical protein [Planctomycetaceae bacterium]